MPLIDAEPELLEKRKAKTALPSRYKVVMLNDDYTPMEFVIEVITTVFNKPAAIAASIMWKIHNTGSAIVGVYTKEIAEEKAHKAIDMARKNGHPLICVTEKE